MIEGDCDCDGNQFDALANVVVPAMRTSTQTAFVTTWTIAQALRCVRVCNGPGAIYGAVARKSLQVNAIVPAPTRCPGRLRWRLRADADMDGICDDEDDCIGEFDVCGICNGPGAIYECGCADIIEGDCDCDGNQLDALGSAAVLVTRMSTRWHL